MYILYKCRVHIEKIVLYTVKLLTKCDDNSSIDIVAEE